MTRSAAVYSSFLCRVIRLAVSIYLVFLRSLAATKLHSSMILCCLSLRTTFTTLSLKFLRYESNRRLSVTRDISHRTLPENRVFCHMPRPRHDASCFLLLYHLFIEVFHDIKVIEDNLKPGTFLLELFLKFEFSVTCQGQGMTHPVFFYFTTLSFKFSRYESNRRLSVTRDISPRAILEIRVFCHMPKPRHNAFSFSYMLLKVI